jgi:hypothetical protein
MFTEHNAPSRFITTKANTDTLAQMLVHHAQVCRVCRPNLPCQVHESIKRDVAWSKEHEGLTDQEKLDKLRSVMQGIARYNFDKVYHGAEFETVAWSMRDEAQSALDAIGEHEEWRTT